MTIQLLHDPTNGPAPRIGNLTPTTYDFRSQPGWPAPDCRRCGRELAAHIWQAVDTSQADQGGVIDCAIIEKVPA